MSKTLFSKIGKISLLFYTITIISIGIGTSVTLIKSDDKTNVVMAAGCEADCPGADLTEKPEGQFGCRDASKCSEGRSEGPGCFLYVAGDYCYSSGPVCGNNRCESGENYGNCPNDCSCTPVNGGWSSWSTCDNGSQTRKCNSPQPSCGGTSCTGVSQKTCQLCGNGDTEGTEVCDKNTINCTINGYNGTSTCKLDCSGYDSCIPSEYCGDGTVNGNEQCDDGNTTGGDGCSATCLDEDTLAPTTEVFIQGDLDETKDIVGNGGWHGEGWYESYDNINLRVATGELATDQIFYQLIPGDVACPAVNTAGYAGVSHDTNIASLVNPLADGEYSLCFYGEDSAGNTEATVNKVLLRKDNVNPTFTILGTSNTTNLDSTENWTVSISASDDLSGYTRARYDLYYADEEGTCTTHVPDGAIPGYPGYNEDNLVPAENTVTRDLTQNNIPEGNWCFMVWIYDDVQNKSTTQEVKFIVDTTPPAVPTGLRFVDTTTDLDLDCNSYTNKENGIKADWDDVAGADHYEYYIDYPSLNPIGTRGTWTTTTTLSEYLGSFNQDEGVHGFAVRSVDADGNASAWTPQVLDQSCQITFDKTPPTTPTVTSPVSGQTYSTLVHFEGTTNDNFAVDKIRVYYRSPSLGAGVPFDGSESYLVPDFDTATNSTSENWSFDRTLSVGTYDFKIGGIDLAGNVENSFYVYDVTVSEDLPTTPTNLRFTNPDLSCGSFTNSFTITADWDDSTSAVGINHYEYESFNPPSGAVWQTTTILSEFSGSFSLGEGLYGFRVRAVDNNGAFSPWTSVDFGHSCQVTYDITDPETPPEDILHPLDGETFASDILFQGTTIDTFGVAGIRVYYRTPALGSSVPFDPSITYPYFEVANPELDTVFDWNFTWTPPAQGSYDFKISGIDLAGNVEGSAYTNNIVFDSVAPELIVDASKYTNYLRLNIEGYDATTGVNDLIVQVYDVNDNLVSSKVINGTDFAGIVVKTDSLNPGSYVACIKAVDKLQNQTDCTSIKFSVDDNGNISDISLVEDVVMKALGKYL